MDCRVHPDGRRVPSHIAVGAPSTLAGGDPAANYESRCLAEIGDLTTATPVIGFGTLSALLNAVEFLGVVLHAFLARGGRVVDPEGDSDIPLARLFGPLLRDVSSQ